MSRVSILRILTFSFLVSQFACLEKAKTQDDNVNETTPANELDQVRTFGHFEPPCSACHEKDRPAAPHEASADCVGCHKYSDWSEPAASFNHNPAPAQCNACHSGDRPAPPHIEQGDCAGCHSFPSWDPNEI